MIGQQVGQKGQDGEYNGLILTKNMFLTYENMFLTYENMSLPYENILLKTDVLKSTRGLSL